MGQGGQGRAGQGQSVCLTNRGRAGQGRALFSVTLAFTDKPSDDRVQIITFFTTVTAIESNGSNQVPPLSFIGSA